jgi:hypothetical protein
MTLFHVVGYLMPLLVGLLLPALLVWGSDSGWSRIRTGVVTVLGFAGTALLLLVCSLLSGDSFSSWLSVTALSASVGILIIGCFLLLRSFRLPPLGAQIVSGLLIILIMSSVFGLGPILRDAHRTGLGGEEILARVNFIVSTNPYTVTAYSIFGDEVLHRPILYATDAADYPFAVPVWSRTATGYLLLGAVLFLFFGGVQILRWKVFASAEASS